MKVIHKTVLVACLAAFGGNAMAANDAVKKGDMPGDTLKKETTLGDCAKTNPMANGGPTKDTMVKDGTPPKDAKAGCLDRTVMHDKAETKDSVGKEILQKDDVKKGDSK